jgi:hypothetical protein
MYLLTGEINSFHVSLTTKGHSNHEPQYPVLCDEFNYHEICWEYKQLYNSLCIMQVVVNSKKEVSPAATLCVFVCVCFAVWGVVSYTLRSWQAAGCIYVVSLHDNQFICVNCILYQLNNSTVIIICHSTGYGSRACVVRVVGRNAMVS